MSEQGTGPELFTIGHSNHSREAFLERLRQHAIDVLVDVRSQPYSRYTPHFNTDELRAAVTEQGIRYVFLGRELGGRPEGAAFYDAEGHVLYGRVAESAPFLEGVEKVLRGGRMYRVALMCSEENPAVCHRHLLVARVLSERGANVVHIRGDGRLQTEDELLREEAGGESLFAPEEVLMVRPWKSLRSVSPKKAPPTSSDG